MIKNKGSKADAVTNSEFKWIATVEKFTLVEWEGSVALSQS